MRIKRFVSVGVFMVSFLVSGHSTAHAVEKKPDLTVSYLGVNPISTEVGKETTISFRVLNDGNIYAKRGFLIKLSIDGKKEKQWKAQKALNPGYPQSLSYKHKIKFDKSGKHEVKVEINTSQRELSKINNVKVKYVDVKGATKNEEKKSKKKPKKISPIKEKPSISITYPKRNQRQWDGLVKGRVNGTIPRGASVIVFFKTNKVYEQGRVSVNNPTSWKLSKTYPTSGATHSVYAQIVDRKGVVLGESRHIVVEKGMSLGTVNKNLQIQEARINDATEKVKSVYEDFLESLENARVASEITEEAWQEALREFGVGGAVDTVITALKPDPASLLMLQIKLAKIISETGKPSLKSFYATTKMGESVYKLYTALVVLRDELLIGDLFKESPSITLAEARKKVKIHKSKKREQSTNRILTKFNGFVRQIKKAADRKAPPQITNLRVEAVRPKKQEIILQWNAEDDGGAKNLTYQLYMDNKLLVDIGKSKTSEVTINSKMLKKKGWVSFNDIRLVKPQFTLKVTDKDGLSVSKNFPRFEIPASRGQEQAQQAVKLAKKLNPKDAKRALDIAIQVRENIDNKISEGLTEKEKDDFIKSIEALIPALKATKEVVVGLKEEMEFLAKGYFGNAWKRFEPKSKQHTEALLDALKKAYEAMSSLEKNDYRTAFSKGREVNKTIQGALSWLNSLASEGPPEFNENWFRDEIEQIKNIQKSYAYDDIITNIEIEISESKSLLLRLRTEQVMLSPEEEPEIEFSNIKIANKYNMEDIEEQLCLNRDDLISGYVQIAGKCDDERKGASIRKIEIDIDDGKGWQPALGRNRWKYKFRPKANQTYTIAIRAITLSGEPHEAMLEPVEIVYEEAGDQEIIRQIIYEATQAYEDEDLDKYMSFFAEDFKNITDGSDYYQERDTVEDEFSTQEDTNYNFETLTITLSGSTTARVSIVINETYTQSASSTRVNVRKHDIFTLNKRNGVWLKTEQRTKFLSATDTTAPTIVSTSPVNGETGVSVNTDIILIFNESMRTDHGYTSSWGLSYGSFMLSEWNGTMWVYCTWYPTGWGEEYDATTYTFTRSGGIAFAAATKYRIVINNDPNTTHHYQDTSGNRLTEQQIIFTTE